MSLLLALLVGVLPGLSAGLLVTPDPARPGVLATRVVALGTASWLLVSGVLVATVGLSERSAWWAGAVTGLAAAGGLATGRARGALSAAGRDLGFLVGLVAVTSLVWLPVALATLGSDHAVSGSTPWYYWGLAEEVADAGRIPATDVEFGTEVPFLADYRLFSAGTALFLVVDPTSPLTVLHGLVVAAALLLGTAAGLSAVALGSGRLAALVAVPLAVTTGIGALRLLSYKPEALGLALTLLLLASAVDWLRSHEGGALLTAALVTACLAQVHGIALVSAAVLAGAAAVALFRRSEARGDLLATLALVGAPAVATVAVGFLLGGAAGTVHQGLVDVGGLADPTWEFIRAARGRPPSLPPSNSEMVGEALARVYDGPARWALAALAVAAVLLLTALARGVARPTVRRLAVLTGVALAGLAGVGSVLALGWEGYVPRRTGAQRFVLEATLLTGPVVAVATGTLGGLLRDRPAVLRLGRVRAGPATVARAAVSAAVLVAGLLTAREAAAEVENQRPEPAVLAALGDLGLGPTDLVLADAYTEGYLERVTGAQGLLEGRAPYTFPDLLQRANALLRGAQAFFAEPSRHDDFLAEHGVTHVVVGDKSSWSLGTNSVWDRLVRPGRLARCPGLVPVLRIPELTVYRVVGGCGRP